MELVFCSLPRKVLNLIDLLDRDALESVLECVQPNYMFAASLVCRAMHAILRRPGWPTDVLAMNRTATLLKWSAGLSVPCPPLKCVADLGDTDHFKRVLALGSLGNLDKAVVAVHAGVVMLQFDDPALGALHDQAVRYAAVNALGKLGPDALAPHADAIADMLDNANPSVRLAAMYMMGNLEPVALARHRGAVARGLSDACGDVRYTAMETLGTLAPAALVLHASDIARMCGCHVDEEVRRLAMHAMEKLTKAAYTPERERTPFRMGVYEKVAQHSRGLHERGVAFLLNNIEHKLYGEISKGVAFTRRLSRIEFDVGVRYPHRLTSVSLAKRLCVIVERM